MQADMEFERYRPRTWTAAAVLLLALSGAAQAEPHKVIFDTDFGICPQDDCYALMLALHSPELEILGITTVAGNWSLEQAHHEPDHLRDLRSLDGLVRTVRHQSTHRGPCSDPLGPETRPMPIETSLDYSPGFYCGCVSH